MADLQILIAAYGPEALERIASLPHAEMSGVEYLVSWQKYDPDRIPSSIRLREDFKIFFEESVGLCNNRNALLKRSSADLIAISDDDLIYTPQHLNNIIEAFETYPDCDIITFRYFSENYRKTYPKTSFNLQKPPKGYFLTSMELVLNKKKILSSGLSIKDISFNPAFGVNGTVFGSGEESILLERLLRKGLNGLFLPADICINTKSTTADRLETAPEFIEAKGAAVSFIYPSSWRLRMWAHAFRASRKKGRCVNFRDYCKWWKTGVRKAKNLKVFDNYR